MASKILVLLADEITVRILVLCCGVWWEEFSLLCDALCTLVFGGDDYGRKLSIS